jgi:hypothetical protein
MSGLYGDRVVKNFWGEVKLIPRLSPAEQRQREFEREEYDREVRDDMIREAKLDRGYNES